MSSHSVPYAGYTALATGDVENFLVAARPGGIKAQEAQGQAALLASEDLPKEIRGATREQLKAMGFCFGEDVDNLFVHCTLPKGWGLRGTDHSMHSDLVDDKGRKRAGIFYKAAFYDRSADMSMSCRYHLLRYEKGLSEKHHRVLVKDGETVIFDAGEYEDRDYGHQDLLAFEAEKWLKAHYPNWENPLAYWD